MTENEGVDGVDHVTSRQHVISSAIFLILGRHTENVAVIGLRDRKVCHEAGPGRILDLGRLDESDDDTEAVARAADRDETAIHDAKTVPEVMTTGVP